MGGGFRTCGTTRDGYRRLHRWASASAVSSILYRKNATEACPAAGQARNGKLCLSCVTAPDRFVKGDVALAAFAHDREGFIVAQLRFYLRIITRVLSYNRNGKADLLGESLNACFELLHKPYESKGTYIDIDEVL